MKAQYGDQRLRVCYEEDDLKQEWPKELKETLCSVASRMVRMAVSTHMTAATTPANPPHLTTFDDTPTPPCSTPLYQEYDATLLSAASPTKA